MLVLSLVAIAIALVVVNVIVRRPERYPAGAAASSALFVVALVLSCIIGLLPFGVTAFVLLIGCLVCAGVKPSIGFFRFLTVAAGIVGIAAGVSMSLPYVEHLQELRERYPFISMAQRLSYETKRKAQNAPALVRFGPPPKNSPAWVNLVATEGNSSSEWSGRNRALGRIHASTVEQFFNAPGFGVGRMSYVNDYWLRKRRLAPSPFPNPAEDVSPAPLSSPLRVARPPCQGDTSRQFENRLWRIHADGSQDFVNSDEWGWFVDRDHVAGFAPHRFSNGFQPNLDRAENAGSPQPELVRLELVSLLKFESPRVYVSNQNLPQMDKSREVPTRALTPFETAALALLEKGDDLALAEQPKRVVALGSLRAGKQCLPCHEVERGTLLGAFSYEFRRDAAVPDRSAAGADALQIN